ncbi:myelin-oligodendrocyte glycoprotein-like isoform X2 [Sarcophilus harrisii]|uniref:myelin-oligodendrocyte glycoprotein-like isoform X2 n=1 Tax=Sarcophilus harrisii TaxID=9305 RepID=UPI001301FF9E|nr:myelin-oligodendrocyte glycoprotein-like isoform X2 [Sarcophilus harrisii]
MSTDSIQAKSSYRVKIISRDSVLKSTISVTRHSLSSQLKVEGMMEILDLSGSFFSNVVIVFIFLLKKPTMTSGQFSVIGPAGLIQASLGGEAELSCYLSPPQSAQHMEVVWLQSTQVVHLYRDGKDQFGDQAPDYQGRTELVRDAITSGNVTLKIRDVRFLDAGRYICLFEDGFHQEEADMELKVIGEETESQTLPPIYFLLLTMFWFTLYTIFLFLMLRYRVYFHRSSPWMGEIGGILIVITSLEVEMALYYMWIRHRCRVKYVCQQWHHHNTQSEPGADNQGTRWKFCSLCCKKLWMIRN